MTCICSCNLYAADNYNMTNVMCVGVGVGVVVHLC